jgi:hypothetical protein
MRNPQVAAERNISYPARCWAAASGAGMPAHQAPAAPNGALSKVRDVFGGIQPHI